MDQSTWCVSTEAPLQVALDDPLCPPLLLRVLHSVHSWQVRNETPIGRTIRASQLLPQWMAALVALAATAVVEGDEGSTQVPVEKVARREVAGDVTLLKVCRHQGARWGEARVGRTPSDDPIVAAFAVVWPDGGVVKEARITLTGVAPQPVWLAEGVDLLVAHPLDHRRIRRFAAAVEAAVEPQGDHLGSEAYRRAMAGVLTRRALEACLDQEVSNE